MADSAPKEQRQRVCATEPSVVAITQPEQGKPKSKLHKIQVGWGKDIPRWRIARHADGTPAEPLILKWWFDKNSFQQADQAVAHKAFTDAIQAWKLDPKLGFKFQLNEVSTRAEAHFEIQYHVDEIKPDPKAKPGEKPSLPDALGFLPNWPERVLKIYNEGLHTDLKARANLHHVLSHEIGHIFGLRHEFAIKEETDAMAQQIGPENPLSVMNYYEWPEVQKSDKDGLVEFYLKLHDINGVPFREITPQLLSH